MADNLYTCLGCKEKIAKDLLVCPKCGFKTAAGRVQDYRDSLTPEQKASTNKFNQQLQASIAFLIIGWIVIIGGVIYLVSDAIKDKPKTRDQIKIERLRFCRDLIKENLKDPSSFKVLNSSYSQKETGIIKYSATNSFGARVQEVYKCFDP